MEKFITWLRGYISPLFMVLLLASFILWYIAKLNYTYTTEHVVEVNVEGQEFSVPCVVEGVGTNLFAYRVYMNKSLNIPLRELEVNDVVDEFNNQMLSIEPRSLQSAISVRCSDIKVISIGAVPNIKKTDKK